MELLFLGTGAADWAGPDERGEYRRLCSTRVGDRLLIDGNPKILDFLKDPENIRRAVMGESIGTIVEEESKQ